MRDDMRFHQAGVGRGIAVTLLQRDSELILSGLIGPINKVLDGGMLPGAVLYCCAGGSEGS